MGRCGHAKKMILLILMMAMLCGCGIPSQEDAAPTCTYVIRIVLSREDGLVRCYCQNGKMEQILDCLRLAAPRGQPEEDPETADGHTYCITVYFSDGQQKSYRQKGDRYLLREGGQWQKIKKGQGWQLEQLLLTLPGD